MATTLDDAVTDLPFKSDPESSPPALLRARLAFYSAYVVYALIVASVLIPLDLSQCEDEQLRVMFRMRFVLYTFFTNYVQCFYVLFSIYVDWKAMKEGSLTTNYSRLQRARNFLFTTFVFPTTLFAGSFFWFFWTTNRTLLVPVEADKYMPMWTHHSIHTVPVIVLFVDLLLVPRFKPQGHYEKRVLKYSILAFMTVWFAINDYFGVWPYKFLYKLTHFRMGIFSFIFYYTHIIFYNAQWYLAGLKWGTGPAGKWSKADHRVRRKGC